MYLNANSKYFNIFTHKLVSGYLDVSRCLQVVDNYLTGGATISLWAGTVLYSRHSGTACLWISNIQANLQKPGTQIYIQHENMWKSPFIYISTSQVLFV